MNYLRPEWNLLVNITRLFNSVSAEPRTMEIRVSSLEAKGERANSRMKHGYGLDSLAATAECGASHSSLRALHFFLSLRFSPSLSDSLFFRNF